MIRLTLPLPPNMANSRMHWRARRRKQDEYRNECDWATLDGRIPASAVQTARLSAHFYLWNLMDHVDNLPARLKWPIDWLVSRGYLVDDDPKHLTRGSIEQSIDRDHPRVEITLEEL